MSTIDDVPVLKEIDTKSMKEMGFDISKDLSIGKSPYFPRMVIEYTRNSD